MRLLARVGSNVPGLVFEAVKGLVAHGTFVGTGQIRTCIVLLRRDCRRVDWHQADGSGSHVVVATSKMQVGRRRGEDLFLGALWRLAVGR